MRDERVERLAEVLTTYSVPLRPGELVAIRGPYVAEPLILALYRRCLEMGAHPVIRTSLPAAEPLFFRLANDEQLDYVWEPDRWFVENLDVLFAITSSANTRQLSRIDPARQARANRARKPLADTSFRRSATGEHRWCVTLFPTEAQAMEARMSLEEYEDFFYGACMVDRADPAGEWRAFAERNRRLIEWMQGRNEVHIQGEGTDLRLEVGGRTFRSAEGLRNFPDGEFFTGPHEDKTNGHIAFTYPALYRGQVVEGVRLTFRDGRVVDASAERNEAFLLEMLDSDPGARVLGELGIGTNYGISEFTSSTLLDEKMGGTVHLALGASYPETGGTNDSAIHWDMVCDLRRGGRITVDGDTLMEDGRLLP